MTVPTLELFLHEDLVGTLEPDARDRSRVTLAVDGSYSAGGVLLSEAFTTLPGRRPPVATVSDFLGGYVPEGNHREKMAAKRHIDSGDLFGLLYEFGGSIAGAVTLRRPGESPRADRSTSRSPIGRWPPSSVKPSRSRTRASPTTAAQPCPAISPRSYPAIERFDRELVNGQVHLRHEEDLAQAMGLDWRDTDVKFQEPDWPTDPRRATARRIGELLGSIPGGDATVAQWLRQLTFHVAIGNNDAHAKNVALMHRPTGTELAQIYDALPNLFQKGLITFDLALAVDGVFDHRRMSVERIVAEATSWGVIAAARAETIIGETLAALGGALDAVKPAKLISLGLGEQLRWNVQRLLAGVEISEPKRR